MKKMILALAVLLAVGCEKEVINPIKTNSMIILDGSGGNMTAQTIKENADIPTQGNMAINGNVVECTNIDTDQITAVIGESDSSVAGLCSSANVNKWSRFSPVVFYNEGGVLASRVGLPYELDKFAGYNHNAITPYIQQVNDIILNSLYGSSNYNTTIQLNLGEVDWTKFGFDYCYILVDGVVNSSFPLSAYTAGTLKACNISLITPAPGYSRIYSVTIWMGNDIQKTSNFTQVSRAFNISVINAAQFSSHTIVNSAANRLVIEDYLGINQSTEYIANIYMSTSNLAISANILSGKYLITAEVRSKSNNAFIRTSEVGGGGSLSRPLCYVKVYKSNNNVNSATYTINQDYMVGTYLGGYSYSFNVPAQIAQADGDYFYLVFDNFH